MDGAIALMAGRVIAAATTVAGLVAVRLLGEDKLVYAISTVVISFLIIIFSVIFVIFQTIKLTIFARSTEIEIMKLIFMLILLYF